MSLNISPEEISFPTSTAGSSQSTSHAVITLANPNSSQVAFKVKTTAPNNYFVKPKAGVLAPGASMEIQVTLQVPYANDPAGANTDRFLVQSAVCQTAEGLSRDEWARLDKFAISEKRLPVLFRSLSFYSATASQQGASGVRQPAGDVNALSREELVSKHQDLASYTVNLEKAKATLEEELRKRNKPAALAKATGGFSLFQLIFALVIAVIVARVSALLGY